MEDISFRLIKNQRKITKELLRIDFKDSRVECYLDHKIGDTKNKKSEKTPLYFKLPYIGRYSDYTNKTLVKIVENLYKDNICIKLIFTPFKINRSS